MVRAFHYTDTLYLISRLSLLIFIVPAFFEITKNKNFKLFALLVLLFSFWALLTAIWSYDWQITYPRAINFAFVTIGASAAGYSWFKYFPKSPVGFLLPANIGIIAVSLFSLLFNLPSDAWSGGCGIGFMGFAPHQNTLGMMILFTIPAVLFPVFSFLSRRNPVKPDLSRRSLTEPDISRFTFFRFFTLPSIFYLLLLLLNLYILILTHSRGSILSLFVIIVMFVFLTRKWKSSIFTALSMFVLFFTVLLLSPAIKEYVFKTESSIGDRRVWHINKTIEAAKHGGLIGLGFGISDPHSIPQGYEQINGQRYVREKMIGVLALIEEVGVIGLAFYLAIISYVFGLLLKAFKDVALRLSKGIQHSTFIIQNSVGKRSVAFMIALLLSLCFNAQIEAWWFGAGSWQFVLFFIFIGTALGTTRFLAKSED